MKPKQIERRFTAIADLYYSLYALIALGIATTATGTQVGPWAIIPAAVLAGAILIALWSRYVYLGHLLKRHIQNLVALAEASGWEVGLPGTYAAEVGEAFGDMSLSLLGKHDEHFLTYVAAGTWQYADWCYSTYQQTKNGEYKSADVFYGAMAMPLSRIMPNVFFDSKTGRGRQFKAQFAPDQRHSLEGDFADYFDTYFAEGYTIDSLSFITPDVMEALKSAASYDIEIAKDHVLLYGPLYTDAALLNDMAAKLEAIRRQLEENITTYRDDRLPADMAATTVTPQGMFLRRKSSKWWTSLVVVVLYVAFEIWANRHH